MGKMNKFYEENCLLQMEFVRGDLFQGSVEKLYRRRRQEAGRLREVRGRRSLPDRRGHREEAGGLRR
ncbi:MAG: hypothetical protein ACLUNQ_02205 [Oscillospiraceae bacterium]